VYYDLFKGVAVWSTIQLSALIICLFLFGISVSRKIRADGNLVILVTFMPSLVIG